MITLKFKRHPFTVDIYINSARKKSIDINEIFKSPSLESYLKAYKAGFEDAVQTIGIDYSTTSNYEIGEISKGDYTDLDFAGKIKLYDVEFDILVEIDKYDEIVDIRFYYKGKDFTEVLSEDLLSKKNTEIDQIVNEYAMSRKQYIIEKHKEIL
jgi:hypothetical protein